MTSDSLPQTPSPGIRVTWRWAEHLGSAITGGYLVLVAVGMLHSFLRYWRFGVNVLDFADPSDFILAPFRDPLVIAATVLPALVVGAAVEAATRAGTRNSARRRAAGKPLGWWEAGPDNLAVMKQRSQVIKYFAMGAWVFTGSSWYQRWVADQIMLGEGTRVVVETTAGDREEGTERRPVMLVGATSRYVFVFRTDDWRTVILPTENVLRLTPDRLARGAARLRPRLARLMDSTAAGATSPPAAPLR